jgi:predicted RNA-binding Zn ribbon-like protein
MSFPKGNGNPQVMKSCEHCAKRFRSRNPEKKYCSDDCYDVAKNNRAYERKLHTGGMKVVE